MKPWLIALVVVVGWSLLCTLFVWFWSRMPRCDEWESLYEEWSALHSLEDEEGAHRGSDPAPQRKAHPCTYRSVPGGGGPLD